MLRKLFLYAGMHILLTGFCHLVIRAQHVIPQVTGFLIDSADHKPLSFVTVGLFKKDKFPQALKTTLTDLRGKFRFSISDTGSYTLVFTHAGFNENKNNLTIPGNTDLGEVTLSRTSVTMKEVKVFVQKPLIEQNDDKIIYNVENDPESKGATVLDIFRKTPFLTVDGDDNVQLNGQASFKVLLNGRETSMFAKNLKEALRAFPGTLISKIEVMTNPPAKYDAEGVGGIINIITKKKVSGYNGNLSTFNRSGAKANNFNFSLNAKTGKVGLAFFYGVDFSNNLESTNFIKTVPKISTLFNWREVNENLLSDDFYNGGNVEISIDIDSLSTLSVYGSQDANNGTNRIDRDISTNYSSSPFSISLQSIANSSSSPEFDAGMDYIKKFRNNKEKEFTVKFYSEFGRSKEDFNSFQDNPGTDRFIRNHDRTGNNQYTLQSDYILPMKKNRKLESGIKVILRTAHTDFESYIKYDPVLDYKLDPGNTDIFQYKQDVISFYSTYALKTKKSTFKIGGRMEFTRIDGDFISSNTNVRQNYSNLVPNLQFITKLSSVTTLVLSYTQRLKRPFIWDLNPFVNNTDSVDISYGNPKLGPQIIHAPSFQARFQRGSTFASIGLQNVISNNSIINYTNFEPSTGISSTTSANVGKGYQIMINGNLNTNINPKWNLNLNGGILFSQQKNKSLPGQNSEGFGGYFFSGFSYKLAKKITASGGISMNQNPALLQTHYPLNIWYNTILTFRLFKDKVNTSLRAVNYFKPTRDYRTVKEDDYFQTTRINTRPIRGFVVTMSWNFGKLKENVSKKKGVNNDDLLNKSDGNSNNN